MEEVEIWIWLVSVSIRMRAAEFGHSYSWNAQNAVVVDITINHRIRWRGGLPPEAPAFSGPPSLRFLIRAIT